MGGSGRDRVGVHVVGTVVGFRDDAFSRSVCFFFFCLVIVLESSEETRQTKSRRKKKTKFSLFVFWSWGWGGKAGFFVRGRLLL